MKRQSIGIVLSALLLSTFGHELLQRHQLGHSARIARSPKLVHPQAKSHALARDNSSPTPAPGQSCTINCTILGCGTAENLTIVINSTTNITILANTTAGVALVIDIEANLVGIFNTSSNTAIIINIQEKTGISIKLGANITLDVILEQTTSLTVYWNQSGTKFNGNNITEVISVEIRETLIVLSGGGLTVTVQESLTILIEVSTRLSAALKIVILVIESSSSSQSITLYVFLQLVEGLAQGIQTIPGGVDSLVRYNIKLSIAILIRQGSVITAISIVVQLTVKGYDWGNTCTSVEAILGLIVSFGGGNAAGASGVLLVIYNVVGFIQGRITIQTLISILIEYVVVNRSNQSLAAEFTAVINETITILQNSHAQGGLQVILDIFIKIRDGSLIVDGINISSIIEVLLRVNAGIGIIVVIGVLVILQIRISIALAIANLFAHLIVLLIRNAASAIIVIEILLGIEIKIGLNLLTEIRNAFHQAGGNFLKFISSVSVFVQISEAFNAALNTANVNVTIEVIFKENGTTTVVIEYIEAALGLRITPIPHPPTLPPWHIFGGDKNGGSHKGKKVHHHSGDKHNHA